MGDVEDIIGTSEAAEILGVTAREVRRKASEGVLPCWRVEGAAREEWRFHRTDVEEYRQQRDEGRSDGRTDLAAVRSIDQLAAAQERHTEAAEALADRLQDLGDLRDRIGASTDAQADAAAAMMELVETIRDQQEALAAARDRIDELEAKLREERSRTLWQRIVGR